MTLTELLVAMAVASIFLVSILFSFSQILRTSEDAEAQVNANDQARAVLLFLARDLAGVRRDTTTPVQSFELIHRTFAYGDGIDNDGDSLVDEEEIDGVDNDGDWDEMLDRHALIDTQYERPDFIGYPDLGDGKVDEDARFGNDQLTLRIPPDPLGSDTRNEIIVYELGTFDGQGNVLLRTVITDPGTPSQTNITEPLAFNVLGFDVLAWNSNDDTQDGTGRHLPYWTPEWDARNNVFPLNKPYGAADGYPPFEFPTSLYLSVTLYSGRIDFPSLNWTGGNPIETLALTTTLDLEATLKDIKYQAFLR